MANEITQIEQIYSRAEFQGNLHMWGKLFVEKVKPHNRGLVSRFVSEGGAPYWQPQMHWFAKKDDKIYRVQMNIGMHGSTMNIFGEDTDIDLERAKFIRENVAKWEQDWIDSETKKL